MGGGADICSGGQGAASLIRNQGRSGYEKTPQLLYGHRNPPAFVFDHKAGLGKKPTDLLSHCSHLR